MHLTHHRSDQPFDMTAVMRFARRAPNDIDAFVATTANESLASEICAIVDVKGLWQAGDWPINDITIIPVPLHRKRRRERGFNQAQLIARNIFEVLKSNNKQCSNFVINLLTTELSKDEPNKSFKCLLI